jgi:cob(I)alamin adenosyltransferase
MKIYTKTGDDGTTSLFDGSRVDKSHLRVTAYGEVDELIAYFGVVASSFEKKSEVKDLVIKLQHHLFALGAKLANPKDKKQKEKANFDKEKIEFLENTIDYFDEKLPPLKNFILPGGSIRASHLHYARVVCRRAERAIIKLHHNEPVNSTILVYINRLSDLLFILARYVNFEEKIADIPWVE